MSSHRKTRKTGKTRKKLSLAVTATAVLATVFALTLTASGSHGHSLGASQELTAHRVHWPHAHRHRARPRPKPSPSPSPSRTVSASPKPKPTPTATPTSTKVSTTPTVSTTGFPGASDTGVPAHTALTTVGPGGLTSGPGWAYQPRGWVEVTGSNVTLQGLYIPFNVDISSASNVTLKDDEIYGTGAEWGVSLRHDKNVIIEADSIHGPPGCAAQMYEGVSDIYGDSTGTQIIGDDIWNTAGPVSIGNGLIQGNYIHDLTQCGSEHNDGIGVNAGSTSLVIDHNTVLDPLNQTCAICLFSDFGQVRNVTIENNLLAGGDYALYGGMSGNEGASSTPGVTVTGNEFSTVYFPDGGTFGPDAHVWSGDAWSGNTWANGPEAGQTVSR
jgi:hypothetical protein